MDDLVARFLPRFAALAKERIKTAIEVAVDRRSERTSVVVHDLHALAGEAGLLGLEGVIEIARSAEEAARRYGGSREDGDAVALLTSLKELERAVTQATKSGS